ncbi:Ubiquilin [Gracilaria domingensis]|nr:Ubiquilin [Gracilaria domingensis]
MHLVPHRTPRPAPASTSARAQPASTPASTTSQTNGAAAPTPPMNNMDPFGMGSFGLGAMGLGDMAQMQERLMRNPEQMQALLNSPMMESIMNNPEFARQMMMTNPQMRELMERNPEVAHVFNDPSTFRQMMQMARNPALMNEMMRNTDRQMANIEMMPGGFDALRRMHENIQAPLMDAAQGGFANTNNNEAGNGTDDNPFSSLFQNTPSNAPMPNPWAPNNGIGTQPAATNAAANPTAARGNAFTSLFPTPPATTTPAAGTANPPGATPSAQNGVPPLPAFPPGMDSERMMQMLDNPIMQQFMQNLLSDPQMFQSMIANNPQLQALQQTNPEMARMFQNPEVMRAFINPEVMRAVRQVHEALGRSGAAPGSVFGATPSAPQTGTTANPTTAAGTQPSPDSGTAPQTNANGTNPAASANQFAAFMNALAAGGMGAAPSTTPAQEMTQEQLEEMYSSQLQQLRDMGFLDKTMCLQALQQSQGNVSAAIENLLSRFGG